MASRLYHKYVVEPGVRPVHIRDGLGSLSDDDVSVSSPISGGAHEVGLTINYDDASERHYLELRVAGHDGDWTKTSEDALEDAVQAVDGVVELVYREGGYTGGDD